VSDNESESCTTSIITSTIISGKAGIKDRTSDQAQFAQVFSIASP